MWLYIVCLYYRYRTSLMRPQRYRIYYKYIHDAYDHWLESSRYADNLRDAHIHSSMILESYGAKQTRVVPVFKKFKKINPNYWQKIPFSWGLLRPRVPSRETLGKLLVFTFAFMLVLFLFTTLGFMLKDFIIFLRSHKPA